MKYVFFMYVFGQCVYDVLQFYFINVFYKLLVKFRYGIFSEWVKLVN